MDRPLKNYLDELETAGSAKQLCQALIRISSGLDIPTFAYIAIPSTAGRQLRLITNYADPWRRHFGTATPSLSIIGMAGSQHSLSPLTNNTHRSCTQPRATRSRYGSLRFSFIGTCAQSSSLCAFSPAFT